MPISEICQILSDSILSEDLLIEYIEVENEHEAQNKKNQILLAPRAKLGDSILR